MERARDAKNKKQNAKSVFGQQNVAKEN